MSIIESYNKLLGKKGVKTSIPIKMHASQIQKMLITKEDL